MRSQRTNTYGASYIHEAIIEEYQRRIKEEIKDYKAKGKDTRLDPANPCGYNHTQHQTNEGVIVRE